MNQPLNLARSLGALFIGFFVLAGLTVILKAVTLRWLFPPEVTTITTGQTVALLAINAVAGLAAGYAAAALAGVRRWQHALVLAVLILGVGLLGARNAPPSDFTTYTLLLSPLSIFIGGWLRHRKSA